MSSLDLVVGSWTYSTYYFAFSLDCVLSIPGAASDLSHLDRCWYSVVTFVAFTCNDSVSVVVCVRDSCTQWKPPTHLREGNTTYSWAITCFRPESVDSRRSLALGLMIRSYLQMPHIFDFPQTPSLYEMWGRRTDCFCWERAVWVNKGSSEDTDKQRKLHVLYPRVSQQIVGFKVANRASVSDLQPPLLRLDSFIL